MTLTFWQIVGLAGAAVYCLSFLLTAMDLVTSTSPIYYLMKLVASSVILTSLLGEFNLTILVLQSFYFCVSVFGIWQHSRRQRATRRASMIPAE